MSFSAEEADRVSGTLVGETGVVTSESERSFDPQDRGRNSDRVGGGVFARV